MNGKHHPQVSIRLIVCTAVTLCTVVADQARAAELKAGAAIVDVTPVKLPVLVNGNMLTSSANQVKSRLYARAIVLASGKERCAVVVVDSCMMSRELLDEAKQLAATQTGIPIQRMLISATHTHTAAASMGCLGTDADPEYVPFLRIKLAEAIVNAHQNLQNAEVAWGQTSAPEFTAVRHWVRRPDRLAEDPFGNMTVRANMHAGRVLDDVTGPAGPEDPVLSLISFRTYEKEPIAVLANYSMHYFGDSPISSDYFGLFCAGLETAVQEQTGKRVTAKSPFVAIMSHGCSGDIWRKDYFDKAPPEIKIDEYAVGMRDYAVKALQGLEYRRDLPLAMSEARLPMKYRVPNRQTLTWAEQIVAGLNGQPPKTTTEVYAREQVLLHEKQSTEVVVQAMRIGNLAIATTPCETYALTGMKIKLQSPAQHTMVIELANGGDGYIPPPEQHLLGGYNTWPARSAGLEVAAEPRIVESALRQLETVFEQPRHAIESSSGSQTKAIQLLRPLAYWRLNESQGVHAIDTTERHRDAVYEPGVVFFLEGPASDRFGGPEGQNRAPHFAGGRLSAHLPELQSDFTVSLWFWNGMPDNAREITGWLVSQGEDYTSQANAISVGLGGINSAGSLVLSHSGPTKDQPLSAKADCARWTWHQCVITRTGERVSIYLDSAKEPLLSVQGEASPLPARWYFGGRSDRDSSWEGRLDEIVVFDRSLKPDEIETLMH